ncbi:MAG: 16S rRNA (cytosine(1402)-N(4))-methyltransferase RsmH [Gemmatimonadota bacterium]
MLVEPAYHRPVLLEEVVALLAPHDGGLYLDGTLGGGGHADAILRACGPTGRLVGVDRDPEAIAAAAARLEPYGERFRGFLAGFDELDRIEPLAGAGFDGALLDLGVSSHQLDAPHRGFAFDVEGPLDMRMGGQGTSAADLLNDLPADELAEIFRRYGEEPFAGPIARAVVEARRAGPLATSGQLKAVLRSAVPAHFHAVKVYARAFQALRLAVNDEPGRLDRGLRDLFERLRPGGRLAVLAYHSLEDRAVKRAFRALEEPCVCPPQLPVCGCGRRPRARRVTRQAVTPGIAEIAENPRARSARLRVVSRLPDSAEPAPGPTP